MDVHRAGIAGVVVLPDVFQHLLAGEGAAAVGDEQVQEVELLGGQLDLLAPQLHRALEEVALHIPHADDLLFFHGGGGTGAAQHRADAGTHLQDIEGLGHVVIRAVFQAEDLIHVLALGGEHDDRHVGLLADALAHAQAVQLGQHYVQQHQVKRLLLEF